MSTLVAIVIVDPVMGMKLTSLFRVNRDGWSIELTKNEGANQYVASFRKIGNPITQVFWDIATEVLGCAVSHARQTQGAAFLSFPSECLPILALQVAIMGSLHRGSPHVSIPRTLGNLLPQFVPMPQSAPDMEYYAHNRGGTANGNLQAIISSWGEMGDERRERIASHEYDHLTNSFVMELFGDITTDNVNSIAEQFARNPATILLAEHIQGDLLQISYSLMWADFYFASNADLFVTPDGRRLNTANYLTLGYQFLHLSGIRPDVWTAPNDARYCVYRGINFPDFMEYNLHTVLRYAGGRLCPHSLREAQGSLSRIEHPSNLAVTLEFSRIARSVGISNMEIPIALTDLAFEERETDGNGAVQMFAHAFRTLLPRDAALAIAERLQGDVIVVTGIEMANICVRNCGILRIVFALFAARARAAGTQVSVSEVAEKCLSVDERQRYAAGIGAMVETERSGGKRLSHKELCEFFIGLVAKDIGRSTMPREATMVLPVSVVSVTGEVVPTATETVTAVQPCDLSLFGLQIISQRDIVAAGEDQVSSTYHGQIPHWATDAHSVLTRDLGFLQVTVRESANCLFNAIALMLFLNESQQVQNAVSNAFALDVLLLDALNAFGNAVVNGERDPDLVLRVATLAHNHTDLPVVTRQFQDRFVSVPGQIRLQHSVTCDEKACEESLCDQAQFTAQCVVRHCLYDCLLPAATTSRVKEIFNQARINLENENRARQVKGLAAVAIPQSVSEYGKEVTRKPGRRGGMLDVAFLAAFTLVPVYVCFTDMRDVTVILPSGLMLQTSPNEVPNDAMILVAHGRKDGPARNYGICTKSQRFLRPIAVKS
ncbi:MAG: hypothetical protein LBI34_02675 [Puniceicoccales bacterium]|jgi:hypothetical protein|nr:hypothetical protein [Puniceicoccales bacterium]